MFLDPQNLLADDLRSDLGGCVDEISPAKRSVFFSVSEQTAGPIGTRFGVGTHGHMRMDGQTSDHATSGGTLFTARGPESAVSG